MKTTDLYDKLCDIQNLSEAWQQVKSKGAAGGLDNVSIQSFKSVAGKELHNLRNELITGTYIPIPYKKVSIEKSNKEYRHLGLLSVRDKIVQQTIYNLIYPIVDKELSSSLYAYRQGKGAVKAIKRVMHIVHQEKFTHVISCDIKKYFDNINHEILFTMLNDIIFDRQLLDIISLSVKMGRVKSGNRWEDVLAGVPQGGIIAPLLANFFLTPFDNLILASQYGYVRYADDFVIFTRDIDEAKNVVKIINKLLQSELKLEIKGNIEIITIEKGFVFLGILFSSDGIQIDQAKRERMVSKINNLTPQKGESLNVSLFNRQMTGFRAFYGKLFTEENLYFIDQHASMIVQKYISDNLGDHSAEKHLVDLIDSLQFVTSKYTEEKYSWIRACTKQKDGLKIRAKGTTVEARIKKRKKEYQKLETLDMEVVVSDVGSYIGKSLNKIYVRTKEGKRTLISTINLKHLTILSQGVSLSSDVIQLCANEQIPITFFTNTGKHYATLYSPDTTNMDLWHQQMSILNSLQAVYIAKTFVNAKIRNQINLLKYFHKYHKKNDVGFSQLFDTKIVEMEALLHQLRIARTNADNYRVLYMNYEARAAVLYWEMVTELINDDSDFSKRIKKGATDLVNSLLNYGYAILYARIWKALLKAKLNPYISYLHVAQNGKPTLVFDFIEQFRQQVVDRVVISLLQTKQKLGVKDGLLDETTKKKLITNIYERLHRYESFRGEQRRLSDIILIQAYALVRYIKGEDKTYKPYIAKW